MPLSVALGPAAFSYGARTFGKLPQLLLIVAPRVPGLLQQLLQQLLQLPQPMRVLR